MEIYGLRCRCHPDAGIRYVGRTTITAAKRLSKHVGGARLGNTLPVCAWIRKHGAENVYFEVLAVAQGVDELERLELEWIERLYPQGNLLNLLLASRGALVVTEKTRAKLSAASKGRRFTDEHRAKISASLIGREFSAEHRARMSEVRRGVGLSDEAKSKIAAANVGKKRSAETRARISAGVAAARARQRGRLI